MRIETVKDFGNALKQGPYAWPGGYPLFFVTSDGGALAFGTAWEERANIAQAILSNDTHGGWRVIGVDVNWEDPELMDDHAGERIESAYAEDQARGGYVKIPESYRRWQQRRKKD
jgi:hypothetical protein